MSDRCVEVRTWIETRFNRANETIEAAKTIEFFFIDCAIPCLRSIQGVAKEIERFVVGLQRHLERMTILSAIREGKSCRIVKAAGCTVDHLRNQGERLQRARPKLFQQQKLGKVMQATLVGYSQHRAESFQIDIRSADFMMGRQTEMPRGF